MLWRNQEKTVRPRSAARLYALFKCRVDVFDLNLVKQLIAA